MTDPRGVHDSVSAVAAELGGTVGVAARNLASGAEVHIAGVHAAHDLDHDGDLEAARHREHVVGVDEHGCLAGEIAGGHAHRAAQRRRHCRDALVDPLRPGHASASLRPARQRYTNCAKVSQFAGPRSEA
jgi:hypothetical protein